MYLYVCIGKSFRLCCCSLFLIVSWKWIVGPWLSNTWWCSITVITSWALADGNMSLSFADSISTTLSNAWINAWIINTGTTVWTFRITLTFTANTMTQWISSISRQTCAYWNIKNTNCFSNMIKILGLRGYWVYDIFTWTFGSCIVMARSTLSILNFNEIVLLIDIYIYMP